LIITKMSRLALLVLCALLFISLVASTRVSVDVEVNQPQHHRSHHQQPHHNEHESNAKPELNEAEVDEADFDSAAPVVGSSRIKAGNKGHHCGIDVSAFNGKIQHKSVVASLEKCGGGATPFCFAKVSEGASDSDPEGAANIAGFESAGCLTGAYHYVDSSAVDKQVANLLANRHGAKYVMIDAETAAVAKNAQAIVKKLQARGIKPIVYSTAALHQQWQTNKWNVPQWVASYGSTKPSFGDLWQQAPTGNTDHDQSICSESKFAQIFD